MLVNDWDDGSVEQRGWQIRRPAAQSKQLELSPKGSLRMLCAKLCMLDVDL